MKDNLLKALESIALGYSEGNVSIDMLIKACDNYKAKTNFDDGLEYQVIVSKSLFDQLNGEEPDETLNKSIVPGQTKYIGDVMYVWTATQPGSKTPFAWHVFQKNKSGVAIGQGSQLTQKEIDEKTKLVNEMFPKDLSTLKVIGGAGGSTGAQIVEDVNGNRYIMKKGTNGKYTSNEHVKLEYLSNQLYDILGAAVPNYELYDENGTEVLLSRFIPNARKANAYDTKDGKEMSKHFLIDCLLNNWDVYQNDNCLISPGGKLYRVDNGGALDLSAHARKKPFNGDINASFISMKQFNPDVAKHLTDADILEQIKKIRAKKDLIVNFLKESNEFSYAGIIEQRIDNLKDIEADIQRRIAIKNHSAVARHLKSEKEMYRVLDQQEQKDIWDNAIGHGAYEKIFATRSGEGHALLADIAKKRGFDARPRVVSDDEYWRIIAENSKKGINTQWFRGLKENKANGITRRFAIDSLLYDDKCFFGTEAAYGDGIYAHVNDGTSNKDNQRGNYTKSDAYDHAIGYAGHSRNIGAIVKGALETDAKIIKLDELVKMLKDDTPSGDKKKIAKLQKEVDALRTDVSKKDDEINNVGAKVIEDAYKKIHYDEDAIARFQAKFDAVDWGKVNAFGERQIPSYQEFVEGYISEVVNANGGTVRKGDEPNVLYFKMQTGDELMITAYQYDGPYSIKHQGQFGTTYNSAVQRFQLWFDRNCNQPAAVARQEALKNVGATIDKLNKEKYVLLTKLDDKSQELKEETTVDPEKSLQNAIYHYGTSGYRSVYGIYAALKGYDAIEVPNGNHHNHSFYVILNRSKMVINKDVDMV